MAYSPPSGAAVVLDTGGPYALPPAEDVNLEFEIASVVADVRQAGGFSSFGMGQPSIRLAGTLRISAIGIAPPAMPRHGIAKDTPRLLPAGIPPGGVGSPAMIWPQIMAPSSVPPEGSPRSVDRVRRAGSYTVPPSGNVVLNWGTDEYSPPPAGNVVLDFGAVGYGFILGVTVGDAGGMGTPSVSQPLGIQVIGIPPGGVGTPSVQSSSRTLDLSGQGIPAGGFGTPTLTLSSAGIIVSGIPPGGIGTPSFELLTRYLFTYGIPPGGFGVAVVTQGTAVLRPVGIPPGGFGTAVVELRNRDVNPVGIAPGGVGLPMIDFRVRNLLPAGIAPGGVGRPVIGYPQDGRPTNYALLLTM